MANTKLKLTSYPPYSIILVDDGSENASFVELWNKYGKDTAHNNAPKIIGIRLEKQQGFGAALKAGYNASSNPYVCFLNSDCTIKNPLWLQNMGESLINLKKDNVRLVAARSNNAVCDIPELEGEPNGLEQDFISNKSLPLYCTLCHRELFPRIGGFVKAYPYGGYEDEELFHRMNKYGMKQGICHNSWVYHEGEATLKNFLSKEDTKNIIIEDNFQRLQEDLKKLNN